MRRPHVILVAALAAVLLAGCAPDTATPTAAPSVTPSAAPTDAPTPAPTATATATPTPAAFPTTCDGLYPADLVATLDAEVPPLNDPALGSLLSTENVAGLEVLGSGVPVLRCTWGAAGTPGLATTLAQVDVGQEADVQAALTGSGFACDDLEGGTVCRYSQQTVDQDDRIRTNGETHWFGGGVWLATHWLDYDPDGYTRALAARLAG